MTTSPRILFVVDAGPEVGGGHVMRSLTLAAALKARGADCCFLAPPEALGVLDAFGAGTPRIAAASTRANDLEAAAHDVDFDAIVFDHYGLARSHHIAMAHGRPALVIDDLTDRHLGGDIIVDAGPARLAADYAPWIEGAQLLLGPSYAPVRPAFAALRDEALARRSDVARRAMVALGLTDVGGVTGRVVSRLRRLRPDIVLDVVVGSSAQSLDRLRDQARNDPGLILHVDTQDMAALTARADLAVGAGGSTTWERCTLGVPSLLVVLADNQKPAAEALSRRGAAVALDAREDDFDAQLDRAFGALVDDPVQRAALSVRSAELCDGRGADRTAEAFMDVIQP